MEGVHMTHGRIARVVTVVFILLLPPLTRVVAQNNSSNVEAQPAVQASGLTQTNVVGLVPSQVRHAYGFDRISNQGAGQTIAIITAFDHQRIEDDLAVFSRTFNLPACTTQNGCFKKIPVGANPGKKQIWALEAAL